MQTAGMRRHATSALPWDVARALAHAAATPLAPCSLPLADAIGSVLAIPLVALSAVPPVDRSAMDGYAVCGPGPWQVVGVMKAASGLARPLEDGQACTIVTGAAVPAGTTAVLPDEEAVVSAAGRAGMVAGQVSPADTSGGPARSVPPVRRCCLQVWWLSRRCSGWRLRSGSTA